MMKPLVKATEAAEILGCRLDDVYTLARGAEIPTIHIGRMLRFDSDALKAWVAQGGSARDRARALAADRARESRRPLRESRRPLNQLLREAAAQKAPPFSLGRLWDAHIRLMVRAAEEIERNERERGRQDLDAIEALRRVLVTVGGAIDEPPPDAATLDDELLDIRDAAARVLSTLPCAECHDGAGLDADTCCNDCGRIGAETAERAS